MSRLQVKMDWDAVKRDRVEFAEELVRAPDSSPSRRARPRLTSVPPQPSMFVDLFGPPMKQGC